MKKNILITGGAGFIGSNLINFFLNKGGFDITVYDNLSATSRRNLNKAIADSKRRGRVRFIKGDILDFAKLCRSAKKTDTLIHLAAHTRVPESLKDPKANFDSNSLGMLNVLEAARRNRVNRFIFASSNAAVGEQRCPVSESVLARPVSPYGAAKLYGEALCCAYYHSYGLRTVALRFSNAYGPYSEHKRSVIANFINRIKEDKPLEIYGDGNQTRDFIHARDISRAIYLSAYSRSAGSARWGGIFQIATGIETSINDLTGIFSGLTSGKKRVIFKKARPGDIKNNFSDIHKAKKELDFRTTIDLKRGIFDLMDRERRRGAPWQL
jgi:UDP-glucose 4-epimerase